MTPVIEVTINDKCGISIEDKTKYKGVNEDIQQDNYYKFKETCAVDVLRLNKYDGDPEYRCSVFNPHTNDGDIYSELTVNFDGHFTVIHIILPTKTYIDTNIPDATKTNQVILCADENGYYKKKEDNTYETINIRTVIELIDNSNNNATAKKVELSYVSICFLKKCYINLCQQIFNNRGFSRCFDRSTVDNDLIYRRDLLLMAINVIKYLTECDQLVEVERIIEILDGCNGLCLPSDITSTTNGCGCS